MGKQLSSGSESEIRGQTYNWKSNGMKLMCAIPSTSVIWRFWENKIKRQLLPTLSSKQLHLAGVSPLSSSTSTLYLDRNFNGRDPQNETSRFPVKAQVLCAWKYSHRKHVGWLNFALIEAYFWDPHTNTLLSEVREVSMHPSHSVLLRISSAVPVVWRKHSVMQARDLVYRKWMLQK